MATIIEVDLAHCQCGCGQILPADEMFWSEDDEPYVNFMHLTEAQIEAHLERYDETEGSYFND